MRTRNSKKKALFDSSEEIDNSDMEAKKPRKSIDSVYSTEDSNASRDDALGIQEEDDFSRLKPRSTKRRVPANLSSDDEDTSQTRPKKSSDSQYSSDGTVKSPKKRNLKMRFTSDSEKSESLEIQLKRPRKFKKKRQPRHVASSSSEDDSVSQARSSQTEEPSDSSSSTASDRSDSQPGPARSRSPSVVSYTTDECEDFIQRGSGDSEASEKSYDTSQASEVETARRTPPKKYTNLRLGSDSSDEDEGEPEPVEESPEEIRRRQQLQHAYKQLKSKILYAKPAEIRDIVAGCGDLVLPEFGELLWQAVTYSKMDPEKPAILVRAGVDVNCDGPGEHSGNSVLHVVAEKALRKGFEGLAFTLIKHGAEIDWCNCEGKTVLHSAVIGGSVELIEELLRRGVELGEDHNKILQVAAENSRNSAEILHLLVEYKAVDKETKIGRAMHALRCLVEKGNDLAAMRVLLDYNLPLDDINNIDGQTLLHIAVHQSRKEMVQLLLEYGANPRQKRRDGTIPLWHAAAHPTTEIPGLLIKYGASVHDCNYDDAYPIHKACNAMSSENIRLFLYLGAKVNVTDNYYNWTPFDMIMISDLNDANKAMIQHLAFLTSKNTKIHFRDLKKIRENPSLRKYYAQCLSELEKMKRLVIFEDISVHSLLDYDVEKISQVTKNTKLIDEYHENREKLTADFPIYSSVIRKRMMAAWWRRDKLNSIESALEETSKYVLTPDVCEKIAYLASYESFLDYDLKEKPY